MDISQVLGAGRSSSSGASAEWGDVEEWVGDPLPADYKELAEKYGEGVIAGHLYIPHPHGSRPILEFMKELREGFHVLCEGLDEIPSRVAAVRDRVVPWAYHDWDGDICLLLPPDADEADSGWRVAIAFWQCPQVVVFEGGVSDFLATMLVDGRWPRGWPTDRPVWTSADEDE
ncbi:hypothetical protein [Streptomyces hoynatensis]|uniref:hypothetical protein n=1 Tax=Streptomyces hoynatensis TaxID=1141874 RepID=UPI0011C3E37D|nr:hypothetical protein [Streptomyces hoynatensis]